MAKIDIAVGCDGSVNGTCAITKGFIFKTAIGELRLIIIECALVKTLIVLDKRIDGVKLK